MSRIASAESNAMAMSKWVSLLFVSHLVFIAQVTIVTSITPIFPKILLTL